MSECLDRAQEAVTPIWPTGHDVLALGLPPNAVNAQTVREYLKALLARLWEQGPQFDGRRPWGYSSWKAPIEEALIEAKFVTGELDEAGYIHSINRTESDQLTRAAIEAM